MIYHVYVVVAKATTLSKFEAAYFNSEPQNVVLTWRSQICFGLLVLDSNYKHV